MSDNRPVRYIEDDGTIVYRASGLGLCDRIYVALDEGMTPMAFPEWFQAVLNEGTAMEDNIRQAFVEEHGEDVVGDQELVELEVMDGVVIRGHIDGRLAGGELWEGKKVRPSGWEAFKRKGVEWHKNYPMQVSVYMHAIGATGLFFTGGLYDPENEEIIETYTHAYPDPPINLLGIRKRIAKLEGLINGDKAAMDVACPSTPDFPCPFYYLHDDDAPEPKERVADEEIAPVLQTLADWEAEKKPLASEVRALDKKIKEAKLGLTGWYEANGLEVGEETRITAGDDTYLVKVLDVVRKGYTVEAGGYTKVTVKKEK